MKGLNEIVLAIEIISGTVLRWSELTNQPPPPQKLWGWLTSLGAWLNNKFSRPPRKFVSLFLPASHPFPPSEVQLALSIVLISASEVSDWRGVAGNNVLAGGKTAEALERLATDDRLDFALRQNIVLWGKRCGFHDLLSAGGFWRAFFSLPASEFKMHLIVVVWWARVDGS